MVRAKEGAKVKKLALLLVLLLSGCTNLFPPDNVESPEELCVYRCEAYTEDKTDGPCLGLVMENWVCDIAHSPRQDVDDEPENQCPGFRQGLAEHFVEVDEDCNVIKVY